MPVLDFPTGIAGFPDHRRFLLVRVEDAGKGDGEGELFLLRSVEDEALRFVVVPPSPWFPDYTPELPSDAAEELALDDADDALVLLVVNTGPGGEEGGATANLMAPVVVNRRTRHAAQVVLGESPYSLREPFGTRGDRCSS